MDRAPPLQVCRQGEALPRGGSAGVRLAACQADHIHANVGAVGRVTEAVQLAARELEGQDQGDLCFPGRGPRQLNCSSLPLPIGHGALHRHVVGLQVPNQLILSGGNDADRIRLPDDFCDKGRWDAPGRAVPWQFRRSHHDSCPIPQVDPQGEGGGAMG